MERAPLRPVPARPAGPVDPAAAAREVAALLPALSPLEAEALALVALADRPRADAAGALGIDEHELGPLLAAARKELRQTIVPLPGSGWCERAEGLISDRLDMALSPADSLRLDVHLRNCPRCVEHERRLVQATDAVLASLGGRARVGGLPGPAPARPGPALAPPPSEQPTEQPPSEQPPAGAAPLEAVPEEAAPADGALSEGAPPAPGAPAPAAPAPPAPADDPAPAPTSEEIAVAAEVLVTVRTRRQLAAAVSWNAMIAIALLLTIAAIGLTVAGILGAEL